MWPIHKLPVKCFPMLHNKEVPFSKSRHQRRVIIFLSSKQSPSSLYPLLFIIYTQLIILWYNICSSGCVIFERVTLYIYMHKKLTKAKVFQQSLNSIVSKSAFFKAWLQSESSILWATVYNGFFNALIFSWQLNWVMKWRMKKAGSWNSNFQLTIFIAFLCKFLLPGTVSLTLIKKVARWE